MSPDPGSLSGVLAAYLQAVDAGTPPDREALCRQHPDLAGALHEFFAAQDQLGHLGLPGGVGAEAEKSTGVGASAPTVTTRPNGSAAGAPAREGNAPVAAGTVGVYEILGELGRGGMGVVYKARQKGLGRLVALKMVLAGGHAGPEDLARFRTEAEAVARLQHPNIVQVHEVGEHNGLPFFSLEFCPGGSLDKKLGGTPLPALAAAGVVETLARAMQAAHDKGVIHRDLKPANVLLAENGAPKITDFGLARKLDDVGQTQSGAIMGTPSYMAPEQAAGKTKEVGPAADTYALGAVLYECLTGRPPFKAATPFETLLHVLKNEPVPVRQLQPGVPRDLETICLKCLQKEPAKRYASALDLAEDLRRFRAGEPILARPVNALGRAWRWCRRKPLVAGLTAAVALLLLTVATVSTVLALNLNDALDDAVTARGRADESARQANDSAGKAKLSATAAETARKEEADQRHKAEQALVRLYVSNGVRLLEDGDLLGALPWLAEALRREPDPAQAHAHRLRLACVLRQCPRLVQFWAGNVYEFSNSADGRLLQLRELTGAASRIRVCETYTGRELFPALPVPLKSAVQFSPDGRHFLVLEAHPGQGLRGRLHELATGRPTGPDLLVGSPEFGGMFSRDGRRLLAVRDTDEDGRWRMQVLDVATGEEVTPPALRTHRAKMLLRSWADRFGSIDRTDDVDLLRLRLWDAATGEQLGPPLKPHYDPTDKNENFYATFAQNGERVAFALGRTVCVWHLTSGKPVPGRTPLQMDEVVQALSFSPDGTRLIVQQPMSIQWWDPVGGKLLYTWARRSPGSDRWHFSPDGSLALRTADGGTERTGPLRLWSWQDDRPVSPVLQHAGPVANWAFAPDGRCLLTLHRAANDLHRGELCLWDMPRVRPAHAPYRTWTDNSGRACFSPDGRRVVAISDGPSRDGIQVRDTVTGAPLSKVWKHDVLGVGFSRDGKHLLVCHDDGDRKALVYNVATGNAVGRSCILGRPEKGMEIIAAAALSPDGRRFVLARVQGLNRADFLQFTNPPAVQLWDADAGLPIAANLPQPDLEPGQVFLVKELAFDANGRDVVAVCLHAGRLPDGGLKLPARSLVRRWDGHTGKLTFDGLRLTFSQQTLNQFFGGRWVVQPTLLDFHPDGRRLAFGFGGPHGHVADPALGPAGVLSLKHQGNVNSIVFRGDGAAVATASDDRTARVWDTATGKPLTSALPHEDAVKEAQFHPNGRWLATVTAAGSVRVWDAAAGSLLMPPIWPPGARGEDDRPLRTRALFDPAGQRLLVYRGDRLWTYDLTPDGRPADDLVQAAELLSGRRIDPMGALAPVDGPTLERHWGRLRGKYPADFTLADAELWTWHRAQAGSAEADEDWGPAIFHLDRLLAKPAADPALVRRRARALAAQGLPARAAEDWSRVLAGAADDFEARQGRAAASAASGRDEAAVADYGVALKLRPGQAALHRGRGDCLARLGDYAAAAADFDAALRLGDDDEPLWYSLAMAHLGAGKEAAYHAVCRRILDRATERRTGPAARLALWICALTPRGLFAPFADRPKEGVKVSADLVERASRSKNEKMEGFLLPAVAGRASRTPFVPGALVHYRLRQWDMVPAILIGGRKNITVTSTGIDGRTRKWKVKDEDLGKHGLEYTAWDSLLLAMAAHQLGRTDWSGKWRELAKQWLAAEERNLAWHEQLELRLLRREADGLLAAPPPKKEP